MALIYLSRKEWYNGLYKCSYCWNEKVLNISNARKTKSCWCYKVKLLLSTKKKISEENKKYFFSKDWKSIFFILKNWKQCIVDVEDFEKVKWSSWNETKRGSVEARIQWKLIKIHRLILNNSEWMIIDHINRNHLDNRKENLRFCTQKQNIHNTWPKKWKYKWVSKTKSKNKYIARIEWKNIWVFLSEEEAWKAYDKEAIKLYWEFAYLNFK